MPMPAMRVLAAAAAGLALAACGTQQATTTSSATQAASSPASRPSTSPAGGHRRARIPHAFMACGRAGAR